MIFYRLQSKSYEIDKNFRSYEMGEKNWYHAAIHDLFDIFGYDTSDIHKFKEDSQEWNDAVESAWYSELRNGQLPIFAADGVSCCDDPEDLIKYFELHSNGLEGLDGEYYILVFEGEYSKHIPDDLINETVAYFEKEIKRMSIKEFLSKYKNTNYVK